ncbi:hypothetical protein BKA70DRAFT_1138900 [Coprinopsis sp. MPI-PUGE-AT-0042]|nr:hypothetical protein BKA70DRAFT_1138900 [Coprinopsis sp. MPI-PUGE-AT-0042]
MFNRSLAAGPTFSIPVGIVIGLLASFVQSLGLTIQRKSHVLNQALPEHKKKAEHRRPLWLLGFAIFFSSNIIGSFVQIAALPVVILAPLGAVSLLWNAFFARLILGDVFSPWMILGTILIAGGAVLIAIFGIVPEPTRSLEDLLELFRRPTFAVYFSILMFIVVVSLAVTHISEFALTRKLAQTREWDVSGSMTPSSDIINLSSAEAQRQRQEPTSVVTDENTPLLTTVKASGSATDLSSDRKELEALDRRRVLIAISYASFSGILSGMCLIFAKSGVQLLILTMGGQNQFWRWESWVLVLGLGVFALLQLWYLHKALVLADPILVCPSAFCLYNLSSIVNGLVYFDQISLIKPLYLCLVSLGIVILLCGVWVVSIQSGGGVVDSAPWTAEAEEVLCDEPPSQVRLEEEDDATIRPVVRKPKPKPNIGLGFRPAPAIERETLSESSVPNLHSSLPTLPPRQRRDSAESQVSHTQPTRRSTMASTRVSPSASQPRFSLRQRLSSVNNDLFSRHHNHHGRGDSSHSHPPLSPTLTSGFQIGLSAVSPGFAIMPVERRSKHVPQRRRTVSEGDLMGALGDAERLDRGVGEREGAGGSREEERTSGAPQSPRWTRFFRGMSLFKRND